MTESVDNRMSWIRTVEEAAQTTQVWDYDVELASESRVVGVLNLFDGAIRFAPMSVDRDRNGWLHYLLRIVVPYVGRKPGVPPAGRKGYDYAKGPASELICLISLVLGTRFFELGRYSGQLTDTSVRLKTVPDPPQFIRRPRSWDPFLFRNEDLRVEDNLDGFLRALAMIPANHHFQIMLAADRYAGALRAVGLDDETVFIRLVSAVEIAAQGQALGNRTDPLEEYPFEDLIRIESLSGDVVDALKKTFETRKAKKRFIQFLERHCAGFFRGGNFKAPHCHVFRRDLQDVAAAIYDARSAALHGGTPMYLSVRMKRGLGWDTDPSRGMQRDQRKYSSKQKLPYPHFFHKLVRHCLLSYIGSLVAEEAE